MTTIFGHTAVDPVQTKYEMGNLQKLQKLKAFGIEPQTSMASSSIPEREVCWSTWYHTMVQIKSFIFLNECRLQFLLSVIVCLRFKERAASDTHQSLWTLDPSKAPNVSGQQGSTLWVPVHLPTGLETELEVSCFR